MQTAVSRHLPPTASEADTAAETTRERKSEWMEERRSGCELFSWDEVVSFGAGVVAAATRCSNGDEEGEAAALRAAWKKEGAKPVAISEVSMEW